MLPRIWGQFLCVYLLCWWFIYFFFAFRIIAAVICVYTRKYMYMYVLVEYLEYNFFIKKKLFESMPKKSLIESMPKKMKVSEVLFDSTMLIRNQIHWLNN